MVTQDLKNVLFLFRSSPSASFRRRRSKRRTSSGLTFWTLVEQIGEEGKNTGAFLFVDRGVRWSLVEIFVRISTSSNSTILKAFLIVFFVRWLTSTWSNVEEATETHQRDSSPSTKIRWQNAKILRRHRSNTIRNRSRSAAADTSRWADERRMERSVEISSRRLSLYDRCWAMPNRNDKNFYLKTKREMFEIISKKIDVSTPATDKINNDQCVPPKTFTWLLSFNGITTKRFRNTSMDSSTDEAKSSSDIFSNWTTGGERNSTRFSTGAYVELCWRYSKAKVMMLSSNHCPSFKVARFDRRTIESW